MIALSQYGILENQMEMANKIEEQDSRSVDWGIVQVWSLNRDGIGDIIVEKESLEEAKAGIEGAQPSY